MGRIINGFGYSVSISGDYAIVGAAADYENGGNSGSAYIFNLFPSDDLAHAITALRIVSGGSPLDISSLKDVNNDGLIGLEEAIFALQTLAGLL